MPFVVDVAHILCLALQVRKLIFLLRRRRWLVICLWNDVHPFRFGCGRFNWFLLLLGWRLPIGTGRQSAHNWNDRWIGDRAMRLGDGHISRVEDGHILYNFMSQPICACRALHLARHRFVNGQFTVHTARRSAARIALHPFAGRLAGIKCIKVVHLRCILCVVRIAVVLVIGNLLE